MSDGSVIYEVRADDSNLDSDLDTANSKVESGSSKIASTAAVAGAAIGAAFVAAGAAAITFGSEFEQALANTSTLIDTSVTDMDALETNILALSDSSGIAATELSSSLYSALSAGIPATEDMSEALGFLESATKLAKAGFTDVDTAVSATAKVLNAYNMDVSETDRVHTVLMQTQNMGITTVDELGGVLATVTPTAAAMGVSFEQVGASLATMTAAGTPAATATTQLNALIAELAKSGTTAADNLAAAAEGTEYAGMSFTEMMDAGLPLNEVLDMMGTYAEESGLSMMDMISSTEAAKGALAIAGENSAAFSENLAAMSTEIDVVGEAYDKVTGTSGEQFNLLLNELKNVAIDLFSEMLPIINEALPVFKDLLDQLIPPLMEMVSELMPVLVELFEMILPPLVELVDMLLPPLIELFTSLLTPITELLGEILPPLVEILNILLEPILELISVLLPPLITLIGQLSPLFAAVSPIIQALAEVLSSALGGAIEAITPTINGLMDILSALISFVTDVFSGNWASAWEGIVNIFEGIFDLIPTAIESVINSAIAVINSLIEGVNSITGLLGLPSIPYIPSVTLPRFHTGGIVDFEGDEGAAWLKSGEMVLTEQQQAQLFQMANGQYSPGTQSGTPIVIYNNLSAEFDADGLQLARVVMQNIDDAAAFL